MNVNSGPVFSEFILWNSRLVTLNNVKSSSIWLICLGKHDGIETVYKEKETVSTQSKYL